MRERLHEVAAAIVRTFSRHDGRLAMKEQQPPAKQQRPKPERPDHPVAGRRSLDRRARHDVGVEVAQIAILERLKMVERKRGVQVAPVPRHAVRHRPPERGVRPAADPRPARREVGGVDHAERRLEGAAARVGRAAFRSMAGRTITNERQSGAALGGAYPDVGGLGGQGARENERRSRGGGEHRDDRQREGGSDHRSQGTSHAAGIEGLKSGGYVECGAGLKGFSVSHRGACR